MIARLSEWFAPVAEWVPSGRGLPHAHWVRRHTAILWVIWLHVPALLLVGVVSGHTLIHVATFDIGLLTLGAVLASSTKFGRRVRTISAVLTLVSCSAVLVHQTDGLTESHFHFFVVVALITLYQEWLPVAVTLLYVVVHYGVIGVFFPHTVFNHEAAWKDPVLWAFIHGGFVILTSVACIAAWRLAEVERENVEQVLDAAGDGIYGVDASGRITFANPVLSEMLGKSRDALIGIEHHSALGHDVSGSSSLDPADCPLCRDVNRRQRAMGQLSLHDSQGAALPVEFIVRPMGRDGHHEGSVVTVRDLRKRHALEARRRELEAERDRLISILEASPDLAAIGRPDGGLIWMNPAGRRLLGWESAGDLERYSFDDFFSAEEAARIYAEDMPLISRGGDWQGEWTLQTADGMHVPVAVTTHIHRGNEDPEDYYVSGIMRDLRPQRAEERARREGERRLTVAEGVARLGSWAWDPSSNEVTWSQGMYWLHGLEPGDGEESFEAWTRTIHPEDRQMAIDSAARALASGEGVDFTYRALRADGKMLIIQSRGELMPNENGHGMLMVGTLLDITEQHAASEALRESEELSRSVIATAGDAYVRCDRDSLVTEWNEQAETIFGWTRNEAIGRTLPHLVLAQEDREQFVARAGLDREPGNDMSPLDRFELAMVHRSGSAVPVEVTAWTVQTGHTPIFSFFIRDISERQATARAKDEFISVVGHELRTPLTSIHGVLGLLNAGLLGELNERGKQMVDIAAHNTDRLVRLINDILDIERLNSGKVSLERQGCDIAVLGKRSVDVMRPMADMAGVRLELDLLPGRVWADPDRIEQTLTNLLSNAIKFSPPGGVVRLSSRLRMGSIEVRVEDQGRGIPQEHLELIFDRFQQVDGSDAREKGGTGLGLAICRTIVEQHGGRIWAESVPGAGSRLTFTLPAVVPQEEPTGGSGPKVLVCGDDTSVRSNIGSMLHPHGFDVVQVPSAAQLLEAAIMHRPAVILLDLRMPAVDGWQAAVAVRDEAALQDIPVVVLNLDGETTAINLPEVVDRLEAPVNSGALVAAVGRAITSRAVGPKLLLVEDDEDLAEVLTERFRQLGIEVHHAATAQRALAMCADIVPDLLVLDLCLPDQDGYAVVAQLRRGGRHRGMPLAVYTASDLSEADRERLRLGNTKFFTKGRITPEQFEQHVLALLSQLTYSGEKLHV